MALKLGAGGRRGLGGVKLPAVQRAERDCCKGDDGR